MIAFGRRPIAGALVAAAVFVGVAASGSRAAGPVTVTRVASPEKALRFEVTVP
jgi:hypothetical protein